MIGAVEPVKPGSVSTVSSVCPAPGTVSVCRISALMSLAMGAPALVCAPEAMAAITTPSRSAPVGVTAVPEVAAAAVVPCWPRATVQVVLPLPPTAVTCRISEPIATEKLGAGKPWSLATVIVVSPAPIAAARVVLADSRPAAACLTAPSAVAMSLGVICVLVGHPPARRDRRTGRRGGGGTALLAAHDRPGGVAGPARRGHQQCLGAERDVEVGGGETVVARDDERRVGGADSGCQRGRARRRQQVADGVERQVRLANRGRLREEVQRRPR